MSRNYLLYRDELKNFCPTIVISLTPAAATFAGNTFDITGPLGKGLLDPIQQ